ncbi:MAG: hypothetical protein Fur0041_13740 [Bacteroidia bacterium]
MQFRSPGLKQFIAIAGFYLVSAMLLTLSAQDYKFSHLGMEEGLSQSVVNCILQDRQGFMWFGTQEGLNRYDGYTFKVYKRDPLDSNSLSNNFIYTLYQDREGKIWIGTNGGGLDCFDPYTEKFIHYRSSETDQATLSNNSVRVIFEDSKDNIWIGTDDGLNLFDRKKNRFSRFVNNPNDPHSLPANRVFAITEDSQGNIWIGTYGKGICMFDLTSRRFDNYILSDEDIQKFYPAAIANDAKRKIQCNQIRSLYLYDNDHLWIGSDGGGLEVFNIKTHEFESVNYKADESKSISNERIFSISDDDAGNIWLGIYEGGLEIFNKNTRNFQHYNPNKQDPFALNSSDIKCLYKDKEGNIWIGTNGAGLNIYFTSTSLITHIRHSERPGVGSNTLQSSAILSVMEDADGLLWIGTLYGGLSTLDRKTGTYVHYPQLSTANNNSILSLFQSTDGKIWVGTYGEGLNCYDKKTGKVKSYLPDVNLQDGTILCITQEPGTGYIWFGSFGTGLYRLDPATDSVVQFTSETHQLSSDYIYSIFFDSKGNMWIGTRGGGVMCRSKMTGLFKKFEHDDKNSNSISNNIVYCINEDSKGFIWLSTSNGLNKLDPASGKFSVWYEKDGLASDNIYAILFDHSGTLWLSHNKGLTRFNPDAPDNTRFRNYGSGTGVQPLEFNQGAYFRNKRGELFFGGQGGLNILNVQALEKKKSIPKVYITSYKRYGHEVPLDSIINSLNHIEVTWRDNNFLFEVAALDFVDPSKNLYQYKLEGFDENWSAPTSNRYISYTNLPGGNYVLKIKAANSIGNWNDNGIELKIVVTPPWWKTNLFYAFAVIVIVAGIFIFIRLRTSAIKRENRILEGKVAERTRELAQKNADITSSIQYARRIQQAILPELNKLKLYFPESFVLYKPKDIVSGDFYWFDEKNNKKIIIVADCTGHGVPGALMSMIGHNLLNQIILENGITEPDKILRLLNEGVRHALKQDQSEQDTPDGMDIAVCAIDSDKREVLFSGALRPLIVIRKGLLSKIDSDRFPIGGVHDNKEKKFTLHRFILDKGDALYMFSDGFADQFGGAKGKKYMVKQLLADLVNLSDLPMTQQKENLNRIFEEWREGHQQVDDVLMVGIKM